MSVARQAIRRRKDLSGPRKRKEKAMRTSKRAEKK
jgi:hypothetical protein